MTKSIYHPVPPAGYKLSVVVPTNFFALFSEVSTKDEYIRANGDSSNSVGKGCVCCVIDGITRCDAFFLVLFHNKQ